MRRLRLLLVVGMLILAGCNTAPAEPTFTPTPAAPTETPLPSATPLPTATPGYRLGGGGLQLDVPFPAALLPDVPARFLFQGDRLQTFGMMATPQQADLDIRLTLLDENQTPQIVVDRGGPGSAETIPQFGLPITGTYALLVEIVAGEAGDVIVDLTRFAPADRAGGGEIELDATRREGEAVGAFTALDMVHAFGVPVRGGDVLVFEVAAEESGVAPHFQLLDGDYNIVGDYEAEPGGVAVSDDTYIPFDADYTLLVRNAADGTGSYTVRVRPE